MVKRKAGYYWVRFKGDSEWIIGKYSYATTHPWEIVACDEVIKESEFEEIDENQIVRLYDQM